MANIWVQWHPYLIIFLQATNKYFDDIDIGTVNNYEHTCLCLIYLSYSVILRAQFDDFNVVMHWTWIEQSQVLLERLERVRRERASEETRSYQEEAEEQFRDKYQQKTMD